MNNSIEDASDELVMTPSNPKSVVMKANVFRPLESPLEQWIEHNELEVTMHIDFLISCKANISSVSHLWNLIDLSNDINDFF